MANKANVKICLAISMFLLAVARSGKADFTFGEPTNMGPTINTSSGDDPECFSSDGLELYLGSDRPGGYGGWDIWVARRPTINDDWGEPTNLGPPVNTSQKEVCASISADGLELYFSSNQPGGVGSWDLWVTNRETKDNPWTEPVNLGPTVNSAATEYPPSISADGLSLHFTSKRPGGYGSFDIWVTKRATINDPWGSPVNLGAVVNSSASECYPFLSANGLSLFFSDEYYGPFRHGGFGSADMWVTARASVNDPWGTPVNLGPMVNSSSRDGAPRISPDGYKLYFCSERPGGFGGSWGDIYQAPIIPIVDFNGDGIVDAADMCIMVDHWGTDEPLCDIGPMPWGDGIVDVQDLIVLAEHLFEEYAEIVHIQWLGHSSVKVWTEDCVVYVDPERLTESLHDATLVCVTHTHGDHYSPSDIARVSNPQTQFVGPPDVVQQYGSGEPIAPGQTIEFDNVNITGVASYNTNKSNHPKSRNWVGFIIGLGSKRIYVAGDTDLIEEMNTLGDIDVAILPAGGTYTMNAVEAAEATQYIQPELAIPYHWGRNVGTLSDAETFAELSACAVKILAVGETISSEDWPKYSPLIAHWELDETEGGIAYDSAGDNDGSCHGGPLWQPNSGKINGAIQLDGIDDYISTDFVLDPAEEAFSVFAWIKGGTAGQVIISQTDGTGTGETWLGAEASDGKLMTGLVPPAVGRSAPQPLVSESVITDGQWHHVGLVWDRSYRYLYVDGIEAARDTKALAPLKASDGGLYIGAGKTLDAASFFPDLIDDVRIYNRALSTEDIEELAG